jgi:hypothetical protein
MHEPPSVSDLQIWLTKSEDVLTFLRHHQCICAVDQDVWFFRGNTVDQLAAFLQHACRPATIMFEIPVVERR